jgi:ATP-binding cassette subfamily F protein 3
VAIISHDRDFLDRLVQRTVLVEDGGLDGCTGGYTAWIAWQEERERQREARAERISEERAHIQEFVDRFRYKASKAAQVQSRIKMLDRMETVDAARHRAQVRLRFPDPPPCGEPVLELRGLGKEFGEKEVLRGLELNILRGDRVLLVGRNGAGKSTLLRLMAGEEAPTSGSVAPGPGVRMAWFAQDQSKELPADRTVLQVVQGADALLTAERTRSYLGAFLFSGDDVHKPTGVLSGGEKSRVALARILLRRANLLLLDEPTNHLDIETKEVLAEALSDYGGALVFVSHDRAFANSLATVVWEVGRGGVRPFRGNLDDFLWSKALEAGVVTRRAPGESAPDAWLLGALPEKAPAARAEPARPNAPDWRARKEKTREEDRRRRRVEAAMALVEERERALQVMDARIAAPEVAADWERLSSLLAERDTLLAALEDAQRQWEAAEASS